ncbi:hypothetical protein M0802_002970 [Mischocyttarus mexicanus]|nr:hypothetical protein M0802_002970 [Mischocyttarus mexicanus]
MFGEENNSDTDKALIEETLTNIWKITLKIKKELDTINELVKENGDFCSAVTHTNQSLLKVIEAKGIEISEIDKAEKETDKDDDSSSNRESESASDIVNPIISIVNRFSKIP